MKKTLFFLSLFFVSNSIYAEERWFFETPEFYQTQASSFQCSSREAYDSIIKYLRVICNHPELDDNTFKTVISNGKRVWVEYMGASFVTCGSGICTERETDAYIGRVSGIVRILSLTPGYYVHQQQDGSVWAYRRGTGPGADRFPGWYIENSLKQNVNKSPEPEYEEPQGFAKNIDLWCDPMTDECRLDGELVLHHELPAHLEMANIDEEEGGSHWCDGPVCYDNTDNFIGLNPFFY